ncbi:MAG: NUDIX domain-containing protein [Pseudomonadota bacterium]
MNPLHQLGYLALRGWWWIRRPHTAGVRVLLLREGRVLLVNHTYRADWHMPGGGVDHGETLEGAARRECREEVGATLGELTLLGVYTNFWNGRTDHVAVFVCQDFETDGSHDWEIAETRLFDLDALPADASPGTRRRIADFQAGARGKFGRW